jgi:hypothetical protein
MKGRTSKPAVLASSEVTRRLEIFDARGYCVLPSGRHPPEVRKALKQTRMRCLMKECFKNCQRLLLGEHELRLTYVEGWAAREHIGYWFEHAWLIWHRPTGDEILDLTLEPVEQHGSVIYGPYYEIPLHEVKTTATRGACIRDAELPKIRPAPLASPATR